MLITFVISAKYDQIERDLIEDFKIAHHDGKKKEMKKTAAVLSHFKVIMKQILVHVFVIILSITSAV